VRAEVWADDAFLPVLAERAGRPVGLLGLYRRPEGDLRVPSSNIDLAFAATLPDAQGTGVGVALTAFAFDWAQEHGFRSMTVDWRSVNLLSSRFWTNRGFRPQYLRLYRAVP
jgi:GNAT superfamily N-acetyltransferase